ncbi:MAG: hypothetical protein JNM46_00325 [Anaerolineales bacterium]|nr:hypothetical protein [Anaerolineales bacterium]
MQKKSKIISKPPNTRHRRHHSTKQDAMQIVRQLIFTTLALCLIALVAAVLKIDSRDFWQVIHGAIGLQGILQGARIIVALNN